MARTITLLVSGVVAGLAASGAKAQDNTAALERSIQIAERTLAQEPYLAQHCALLRTGDYFFHRSRHRAGKNPVISLAAWEAFLRRKGLPEAEFEQRLQDAKRRRGEVQNACSLDHLRAELARLRGPRDQGSAEASFGWNDSEGNTVIAGKGTLTGNLVSWQFTGQFPATRNAAIQVNVRCAGRLDPGKKAEPDAPGEMECRAQWTDKGQRHEWRCRGQGRARVTWSIGSHWFGIWPGNCIGTITAGPKTESVKFGLVSLKSSLGIN